MVIAAPSTKKKKTKTAVAAPPKPVKLRVAKPQAKKAVEPVAPVVPLKKKKVKNFVNNADMLIEINLSKTKMKANPKLLPSECITRKLAMMFLQMVDRYGNRRNWSQYTYLEEFKGAAIGNLCAKWHCFDETKYDNPFAYYTQLIERSFKGQIVKEKKISLVRDALLIDMGKTPSYDAQIRHEQKNALKGGDE